VLADFRRSTFFRSRRFRRRHRATRHRDLQIEARENTISVARKRKSKQRFTLFASTVE
jgi:hypothetical protein